jgi:hypothetical protein
MEYNRFFNIHIQKTGGTYFRENMLKPIQNIMNQSGIDTNPEGEGGEKEYSSTPTYHWCWFEPFITDKTYIYTSIRNPAKRIISHYAWQAARAVYYGRTNYSYQDINKKNFYKWLEEYHDVYQNFQSKNLLYYNPDHSIYSESVHKGWADNDIPRVESFLSSNNFIFDIDHSKLRNRINRVNLIIKSEKLKDEKFQSKVIYQISKDLGISISNVTFNNEKYANQNYISEDLFSKFYKGEIEKLYLHSKIKPEIYFADIYDL